METRLSREGLIVSRPFEQTCESVLSNLCGPASKPLGSINQPVSGRAVPVLHPPLPPQHPQGEEDLQGLLQPPLPNVASEDANVTLVCEWQG